MKTEINLYFFFFFVLQTIIINTRDTEHIKIIGWFLLDLGQVLFYSYTMHMLIFKQRSINISNIISKYIEVQLMHFTIKFHNYCVKQKICQQQFNKCNISLFALYIQVFIQYILCYSIALKIITQLSHLNNNLRNTVNKFSCLNWVILCYKYLHNSLPLQ